MDALMRYEVRGTTNLVSMDEVGRLPLRGTSPALKGHK
jgi:hypothetical protein